MFALSEAVINAQLYGGPPISVKVWTSQDRLVMHVHDTGPGPPNPLTGLVPAPDGSSGSGLGLWLSHQLTNVDIALIPRRRRLHGPTTRRPTARSGRKRRRQGRRRGRHVGRGPR